MRLHLSIFFRFASWDSKAVKPAWYSIPMYSLEVCVVVLTPWDLRLPSCGESAVGLCELWMPSIGSSR
eukprot:4018677-Amphidinium_carterae.1